ncbi:hypothetical protein [Gluconobacter kanchanaburiensis]|uniref:Uncharacterized protein n=1 Tax=Gluconobacter kanchanaburiensis NBRC 103587 TaxID=1307948 RepID=A0A511BAR2_9PROT|nr:hypothetical protein [Gluconobacter kanchanaburiensis]MBF0863076.1 hypothetical protein [Gluconobacter kanchanaburiensis]GEK97488.1 hypothetical protein GKA01_26850 [Gluconobacter kanchanaburiensis NBRC 103587]
MSTRKTYRELADLWGISLSAAKQRVRRYDWFRQTANDGSVTVVVPDDSPHSPFNSTSKNQEKSEENELLKQALETIDRLQERSDQRIKELTDSLLEERAKSSSLSVRLEKAEAALGGYIRSQSQSGVRIRSKPTFSSLIKRLLKP